MFGTKENLFLEVVAGTLETLLDAFRATLAAHRERGGQPEELRRALGNAFVDLITTRGLHTVLLQSFVSGADAAIGAQARAGFLEIYRFLRDEAGFGPDEINTFLSSGMLFSVLLRHRAARTLRPRPGGDRADGSDVRRQVPGRPGRDGPRARVGASVLRG